jgi:hypothetical protein
MDLRWFAELPDNEPSSDKSKPSQEGILTLFHFLALAHSM